MGTVDAMKRGGGADVPLIAAAGHESVSSINSSLNDNPESLELTSGCWNTITFGWMNQLISEGNRRQLQYLKLEKEGRGESQVFQPSSLKESDLFELRADDQPEELAKTIEKAWQDEQKESSPSYRRALRRSFQSTFIVAGFLKLIYDSLQFVGPIILNMLLRYLEDCAEDAEDPNCTMQRGFAFVACMLATNLLQTVVLQQYFHRCFRTGMRVNTASIGMIYKKALRLGGAKVEKKSEDGGEKKTRTSGEIVNLMSVDAQRLQETMTYLHVLWSGPFQIVFSLVFLAFTVGWATVAGVVVMILQLPVVAVLAGRIRLIQIDLMAQKDERIKLTNETFSSIRLLKMYGWEQVFEDRVNDARDIELRLLRRYQILNIVSNSMWQVAPILTGVATFGTYAWLYGDLSPSVAFTALALFNVLRFPLTSFPSMITAAVEANVALGRIQSFLEADDVSHREHRPSSGAIAIEVTDAAWAWPGDEPLLGGINFSVPMQVAGANAHLTVVMGQVGTGKSGLMQALIGDVSRKAGSVDVFGSIAYTAQTAWILNATLKANIIFTSEFDQARYQQVIDQCCLAPDLDQLPNGDSTEIGERGVNLSGGQRQRVALARAIYSSASLLLLDDPLSAVDSEVAKKLLKMLRGPLVQGKSIVLCTHALSALDHADQVIELVRDTQKGQQESSIGFVGTPEAFKQDERRLRRSSSLSDDASPLAREESPKIDSEHIGRPQTAVGKLVDKETEMVGAVSWDVYRTYIMSAGGTGLAACVLFGLAFGIALQTGADYWVSFWSDHSDPEDSGLYIDGKLGVIGYASFSLVAFTGIIITAASFRLTALRAARLFHFQLLQKLLSLPMKFHDTTPQGRILNRFSKDIYVIDETLVAVLYSYLTVFARVLATIVVIAAATPWFLVIIVPLLAIYRYTQGYYLPSSRQLKRIESTLRSPIFSHFSETLDGATTIRAYGQQEHFSAENSKKVSKNMRAWYLNTASNRWLAVRLETLGTAIVCASGGLAVASRSSLAAGVAGLSISYALSVTQALNWVVRMTADRETAIVSVERVHEYISEIPEPPRTSKDDPPAESWPSEGEIQFQDVVLRYRPLLPTVLNKLTLHVQPREKLGICGRTGAGKSSILNALLRIVEIESGTISIDGINLNGLGLHRIRHSISVIPQDPVLFSGNLQFNLDPLGSSNRDAIWQSLERAHLADQVTAKTSEGDHPLDQIVAEAGSNYSLGQRQQMCLARALLRENKILLLDEATSAIDSETDALIQETIRTTFASHTVLCIAHRISTIMHSDRVCVLDQGTIAELEDPKILFQDTESRFHQLAKLDGVQ